jgi:hypothetical protein
MTKDRLTPNQTAKALLASLEGFATGLDDDIDYILNITGDPKLRLKKSHIKNELIYLHIYIILQAAYCEFNTSSYNEIESYFKEELKQAIEKKFSKFFSQLNMANILKALEDYTITMNQALDTKQDETAVICTFAQHVSKRVLGDDINCDLRYLAYFGLIYGKALTFFRDFIRNNIELVTNDLAPGS